MKFPAIRCFTTQNKVPVAALYTQMLQTAGEIQDYNFRTYFVRKIENQQQVAPIEYD